MASDLHATTHEEKPKAEQSARTPTEHSKQKKSTSSTSQIAHAAASNVENAVSHVAHGVKNAIGEVTDKAASTYHAGTEYLERTASELGHRAEHAIDVGARKARRAERATTHFVSTHRFPLMLIGAGLGLMTYRAFNQRKQRIPRRRTEVDVVVTRPTLATGTPPISSRTELIRDDRDLSVGAPARDIRFIDTDSTI